MSRRSDLRTVDDAVPEEPRLQGLFPVDDEYAPDVRYPLLSTHPAVEGRVARLHRLAA